MLQQCTTLTSAKHSAVHRGPSSIPMDCIFCCLLWAFLQIYPAWYSAYLEGRSKAACLGGMFFNVRLAQSMMHRSRHVNRVQGEQKRIFGKPHKCVCYFWVGIQFSQCTPLPLLRKEELIADSKAMEEWGWDAPLRTKLFLKSHG